MRYFKHLLMYAVANCLILLIVGLVLNSFIFDAQLWILSAISLPVNIHCLLVSIFRFDAPIVGLVSALLVALYYAILPYFSSKSRRWFCVAFLVNAVVLILSAWTSANFIGLMYV